MAESILDRFEKSSKAEQVDNSRKDITPLSDERTSDDKALNKARRGVIDTTRYSDTVRR